MRFELIHPEEIQVRESRGLVKDVYDPSVTVREPLSEYRTMLDVIQRIPTLSAAYDILTEFCTYRGFDIIGGSKTNREALRTKLKELNLLEVLPNVMHSLFYFGDAYLELRRQNSKTVNELWPLETTEMRIRYDINGKVEGYVQRPFSLTGMGEKEITEKEGTPANPNQGVFFEPEEVIHFRMKWIGSQVYSYNPNQSILEAASTKLYAGNYLMNIFINMPPRYVAHLAGISRQNLNDAKGEFQATKTNYKKTIAFSRSTDPTSKLELKKIDPPYDKELIDVIKYLEGEMLKITRIPRTWIEESSTENRGVGESLQLPLQAKVQFIHRIVLELPLNKQLLKAIGHSKKPKEAANVLAIRFNEITRKGEKEILDCAKQLKEMGLKHEALVTYLDERGILGLDPTDFEELEIPGVGEKDKDGFPSREKMDKSMKDMTQNRNESGVSDPSAKRMGLSPA